VDVIGDFYDLRKRGVEYECKCPFHADRHLGSFKISPKKNYAKCFSCGWQGGPVDFLMEHEHLSFMDAIRWLGKKYSIDVEGSEAFDVRRAKPRQQVPALPMLVLPAWMVRRCMQNVEDNTLVKWIRSNRWDEAQKARIAKVLEQYGIGTARNGMTIFWQVDDQNRVRTGKMMLYKADGHRDKEAAYGFDWIHSALYRDARQAYSADRTDVKTCIFGLHLLNYYTRPKVKQDVCIVESEKTALIMAIAYGNNPKQVWMACGGLGNINRDKLKPIIQQKRNIILYPDRDGVKAWKDKAKELNYDRVQVDDRPVTEWWVPEDGPKADIADVVVRLTNSKRIYKTVEEVIEDMPQLKQLHDKLNLELIDQGTKGPND
jgi:hypothetical protein